MWVIEDRLRLFGHITPAKSAAASMPVNHRDDLQERRRLPAAVSATVELSSCWRSQRKEGTGQEHDHVDACQRQGRPDCVYRRGSSAAVSPELGSLIMPDECASVGPPEQSHS